MESKTKMIKMAADKKLTAVLQMRDISAQKALLANMRRGIGRAPGDNPELWALIMENIDDMVIADKLAEDSLFKVFTLFGMHQQGYDPASSPMYVLGNKLGKASAELVFSDTDSNISDAKERIIRRFSMLVTSTDADELYNHLKSMIQLMRARSIPLDYSSLAADIFLANNPEYRSDVFLRWGQDFYREINRYNYKMEDSNNE